MPFSWRCLCKHFVEDFDFPISINSSSLDCGNFGFISLNFLPKTSNWLMRVEVQVFTSTRTGSQGHGTTWSCFVKNGGFGFGPPPHCCFALFCISIVGLGSPRDEACSSRLKSFSLRERRAIPSRGSVALSPGILLSHVRGIHHTISLSLRAAGPSAPSGPLGRLKLPPLLFDRINISMCNFMSEMAHITSSGCDCTRRFFPLCVFGTGHGERHQMEIGNLSSCSSCLFLFA